MATLVLFTVFLSFWGSLIQLQEADNKDYSMWWRDIFIKLTFMNIRLNTTRLDVAKAYHYTLAS